MQPTLVSDLFRGEMDRAIAELPSDAPVLRAFGFLHGASDALLSAVPQAGLVHACLAHASLASLQQMPPPPGVQGADPWEQAAVSLRGYLELRPVQEPTTSTSDDPALRIELLTLRALSSLGQGTFEDALNHARRACRAAYAESMRLQEYFAYWALARTRRASGNPFAAARIAAALARAAPHTWWPLLDWELVLAGGDQSAVGRPLVGPARHWEALCAAAVAGDRKLIEQEQAALTAYPLPPRFAQERDLLIAGLEGYPVVDRALEGVASALYAVAEHLDRSPAVWRCAPGHVADLVWCIAPLDAVPYAEIAGERPQHILAALIEAGSSGLDEPTLFERVYGFPYRAGKHENVLRVTLHRLRTALAPFGEIERKGAQLIWSPSAQVLCPEPRCAPSFGDRILRLVALFPHCSADQLAGHSGEPLRKIQRALKQLGEDGACRAERQGRKLVYTMEDSAFSEPTHFGAHQRLP